MPTLTTPHLEKLNAAIENSKTPAADKSLLREAKAEYKKWISGLKALKSKDRERVKEMVGLLNAYKDKLEVDFIAKRGTDFLRRQKGQLKLDNSVLEEFLPYLASPDVVEGLNHTKFLSGPQQAFMSLSFMPRSFETLSDKPEVVVKVKDQDFIIGSEVHYKFSSAADFGASKTASGKFALAVLAAECKVNLDKTMFQEAAGTAARLKQGCPVARYFLLVEHLDMRPEDPRLAQIDNVFLLRKAKRLPFEKRNVAAEVEAHHKSYPIAEDVVWCFVQEIKTFVSAVLYDPESALRRGSFV